jgi:hypothetical protein
MCNFFFTDGVYKHDSMSVISFMSVCVNSGMLIVRSSGSNISNSSSSTAGTAIPCAARMQKTTY